MTSNGQRNFLENWPTLQSAFPLSGSLKDTTFSFHYANNPWALFLLAELDSSCQSHPHQLCSDSLSIPLRPVLWPIGIVFLLNDWRAPSPLYSKPAWLLNLGSFATEVGEGGEEWGFILREKKMLSISRRKNLIRREWDGRVGRERSRTENLLSWNPQELEIWETAP